jgi:hypothetical protein
MTDSFTFPVPTTVNEDRVLFGPMAEVAVTHGFMLEVNALYKPKFNYRNFFTHVNGTEVLDRTTDVSAHSWEIPLLPIAYPSTTGFSLVADSLLAVLSELHKRRLRLIYIL